MKEYIFGLFDENDVQIDQTSIGENDDDLAFELFKEFEQTEDYNIGDEYYVILLEEKED